MFRTIPKMARLAVPTMSAFALGSMAAFCDDSVKFDARGMPTNIQGPKGQKMNLSGVGMRAKNFYITSVNVYLCGMYMSSGSQEIAKKWKADGSHGQLADALLSSSNSSKSGPRASVTLRFVRTVGTDKVVEAFNDAFTGCDASVFKSALSASIGKEGCKDGDEISFMWIGQDSMLITKNGSFAETVSGQGDVCNRLLNVYLNPTMAVSAELVNSVTDNI
jgi:hypothetical protein